MPILPDYLGRLRDQQRLEAAALSSTGHQLSTNSTSSSFLVQPAVEDNEWAGLGVGYVMCVKPLAQFAINGLAGPVIKRCVEFFFGNSCMILP